MSIVTEISDSLRSAAVVAYQKGSHNDRDLAESLGVFPTAVKRMISEPEWPIERSIRFLEALGRDVEMQVH